MLDQSFSVKNLRDIYDIENRNGRCLEILFPLEMADLLNLTKRIKNAVGEKKKLKKDSKEAKLEKQKEIDELKKEKEKLLKSNLEIISKHLINSNGLFDIEKGKIVRDKQTYIIKKTIDNIFISKQIQLNLNSVFKVKQSSRNLIISQLKSILDDNLPKIIIKTDIEEFYETVSHEELLKIIYSNTLLNNISKKAIKQALFQYKQINNEKDFGIPRGLGISAYLSEIYMKKLDEEIRNMSGLIYYARYVDDIIMVFENTSLNSEFLILEKVDKKCSDLKLTRNKEKTFSVTTFNGKNVNESFDFLGYHIAISHDKTDFTFSNKKIEKYKYKIKKAFDIYKKNITSTGSGPLLFSRIRFLTSNTKLLNNKNNIAVGIYYSNRFITNPLCLQELDNILKEEIKLIISDKKLEKKLKRLSFERGFYGKIFHKYKGPRLKRISKIWSFDEKC